MPQPRFRGNTPDEPNTMPATRRTTAQLAQKSTANEVTEDIQNALKAHSLLETTELVVPPGQKISLTTLTTALDHVMNYKGLSKPAINTICAVALLMEELEKDNLKETIHNSVMCQLNELRKDIKTFITEATSQINKAVGNNVNAIACLIDEDYTKQLVTNITDILQTKVDYLTILSTSHDNNISIQLDSHLAPITAKLATIDQITEQSASKLAEIAISTKLLVNKPPVPAPPLPMPTATLNLTPPIPASYANALINFHNRVNTSV